MKTSDLLETIAYENSLEYIETTIGMNSILTCTWR